MHSIKKTGLALSLAGASAAPIAHAQETIDNGLSYGARATVEADAKLAKGLHLLVHEETRFYSRMDDIFRSYTGVGLEYKVAPFLKVGAEYEFIKRYQYDADENANLWSPRPRGNFFATGTLDVGSFRLSLKETLRLTHRPDDLNVWQSPRNALALKSRLMAKCRGWGAVVPYAAFEVRNTLNDAAYSGTYVATAEKNKDRYVNEEFLGYTHAYVNRLRGQLGVTVKFSKQHEVDFYLLADHYKDKKVDTNREGSTSWNNNGLVLKSINWYTGNMISGGISYTFSF